MDGYLLIKWLHILSAVLLLGTGTGTAFHLYRAHCRGDVAAIAQVTDSTVSADWWFTAPAILIQPVTGLLLVELTGRDYFASWLVLTWLLYAVAGLCWIAVVFVQYRLRSLATLAASAREPLPSRYYFLMRVWYLLGWPAFVSLLIVFGLMVFKPVLW